MFRIENVRSLNESFQLQKTHESVWWMFRTLVCIHSTIHSANHTQINSRFIFKGYKVYYTTNPNQPEASWNSQMVDNSELTTISELTPLAIYTIRVQAFTSMGAGPMSNPVQVKTQQGTCRSSLKKLTLKCNLRIFVPSLPGVPSQPSNFRATDIGETAVTLQWSRPSHSGENIVHYELYWNDTYANEQHHQ